MIPKNDIGRIFHVNSMEMAPEDWDSDPVSAKIYKDAMTEILTGDADDDSFAIEKIMQRVKSKIHKGYDYRIYRSTDGRPQGAMHMLPSQITAFVRYGNVTALDFQSRTKNCYGWAGCYPAGTNNNNRLQNFSDSLAIEETDHYYAWVVRCMCAISGRPISSLDILPVDGGLEDENFRSYLPGEQFLL